MKEYTASKSLPPGRSVWVMTFRHPLRRDPKGKFGLKVRKSLTTTDEPDADRLILQMNELLGDASFHSIVKRPEAERRFASLVVSAFYDALEVPMIDPIEIREAKVPTPKNFSAFCRNVLPRWCRNSRPVIMIILFLICPRSARQVLPRV